MANYTLYAAHHRSIEYPRHKHGGGGQEINSCRQDRKRSCDVSFRNPLTINEQSPSVHGAL